MSKRSDFGCCISIYNGSTTLEQLSKMRPWASFAIEVNLAFLIEPQRQQTNAALDGAIAVFDELQHLDQAAQPFLGS